MRIAKVREAYNTKISLLTSKLNIELKKKLVRCYVWNNTSHSSGTWTLRKLKLKFGRASKCGAGGEWRR